MSMFKSEEQGHQRQFAFEGRFTGFVPHAKKPFKYIRLMTAEGEYCIKLPKYLQLEVVARFTPGDWVQSLGTCKERTDGTLRYKAENIIQAKPTSQRIELEVATLVDSVDGPQSNEAVGLSARPQLTPDVEKDVERPIKILMCGKSKCMKRGGKAVCQYLEAVLSEHDLGNRVTIKKTGCMDRCKSGPNLVVMPDKAKYRHVTPAMIDELLEQHL